MKKIQSRGGETLIETLAALLIATLVCVFLATAVATAVHVNEGVRDNDVSFRYEDTAAESNIKLIVDLPSGRETYTVREHKTSNDDVDFDYRYYTYIK